MTPDEIRELIRQTSNQSDQRQSAALAALGSALEGIEEMKKYGFFFELGAGTTTEAQEWPKMVYHKEKPAVVVHSQEEMDALEEGWQTEQHPEAPPAEPTEPMDPQRKRGPTPSDPMLLPPPTLSAEALDGAKEAGRQAKREGKGLDEVPEGPTADAWRQGFTEEAAWEEHDRQAQPAHGEENPPPTA